MDEKRRDFSWLIFRLGGKETILFAEAVGMGSNRTVGILFLGFHHGCSLLLNRGE